MKKPDQYVQCRLTKNDQTQVSWIPECFAQIGNILKLKDRISGVWSDGWRVDLTSEPLDAKIVEVAERKYLKQRAASDVSFAKIKKENDCF